MILFTLACAAISLAVVGLAVLWHRFAPDQAELVHEKALYAGFVADVERRLAAGELDADAAREEKVEAARALLKVSEASSTQTTWAQGKGIAVIVAAVAAGFGVYLLTGHPGMADQPYQQRLERWTRMAQNDPDAVPPEVMAMVLRQGEAEHGGTPDYWRLIARFHMLAGNSYDGMKAYRRAFSLAPQDFTAWSELGEALTLAADDRVTPDAKAAFLQAVAADPQDARAHYYLGRAAVAEGQFDVARQYLRTALTHTAPDNPSRPAVEAELRGIDAAETADRDAKTRIAGMVGSLAASLQADPENADGWARLLRSYTVLGDEAAYAAALRTMQGHYGARPEIAAAIVEKSKAAVGAQ